MKRVSAICVYRGHTIYNLTFIHKGNLIPFLWDGDTRTFETFWRLHEYILNVAKANGFSIVHYTDFGTHFYDIQFLDLDNPTKIAKMAHMDASEYYKLSQYDGKCEI